MGIIAGQGDPTASMTLLWGRAEARSGRRAPGPKPGLTVDAIVEAAIAVADEAASAAGLSMRTVAERLGCSSMALYTYVPGKAELLDVMYDRVHAELPTGRSPGEDWRSEVTAWASDLKAFYLRHPWVLQVSYARPVLGPHEQAVLEALLRALSGAGLRAGTLRAVVSSLLHFVQGAARTAAETRRAAAVTGVSDQDWWGTRVTLLNELAPDFADRFPLSTRLASSQSPLAGDEDPADAWERETDDVFAAGLAVLLDGIEAAAGSDGC
ncbi:TetR/AcrR family transcriptional regulator C-terminal domain-containing protein [Streptomyces huiliensis]|uniref:TetR/AcrR family transcriptional regulator C-terminal domain-containing protein n=1 Tax=Streptomyces huiliensis TaxID=2876027 RepID=UPI001CBF9D67|nr:TetR/AcrR family transcriptional regulator C-terminal domain-containing protein [Streptomyces huiliensis]MBZ4322036.1 TetR/AcrR family transcriptional regulator C-terminal domain-containing protein [Streptomyces huiliensis]